MSAPGVRGTIYMIHFERPLRGRARHYTGWTSRDVSDRLAEHAAGTGSRLMAAVVEAGIGWELAATWVGDRHRERAMKRRPAASRCPLCRRAAERRVAETRVSGADDESLAAWAGEGDEAAFAELHRRYAPRLAGYLTWRVHGRADVADVAQEVFAEALLALRDGARPEGFGRWLFAELAPAVAGAYSRDRWYQAEAHAAAVAAGGAAVIPPESAAGPTVGLSAELAAAVASLPQPRRRVVELRYLDGLSLAATAAALGRSRSSVGYLARRGLDDLYAALAGGCRRPDARAVAA